MVEWTSLSTDIKKQLKQKNKKATKKNKFSVTIDTFSYLPWNDAFTLP
jgi:hypothetical protein